MPQGRLGMNSVPDAASGAQARWAARSWVQWGQR